jgi:hypothetical protein
MTDEEKVLTRLGLDYSAPASGCCGMAGAFGFEEEKYDISVSIGEMDLLPAVRKAAPETLIIADGFSCREQIAQCTDRHAMHIAEVLQMALRQGGESAPQAFPEREASERHEAEIRRSMRRSGLAVAGIAAGLSLLWAITRR